jgi:hypothetical protein
MSALLSASGQQEQLAGDELVVALDGFLLGGLQQLGQVGADLHLVVALHLGQLLDGGVGGLAQAGHIGAGTLEQRARAVVLGQHGGQQVHGFDVGVVVAQGQRLGVAQGFLELGGEFVLSHGPAWRRRRAARRSASWSAFPPGGGTDAIARTLADKLKDELGARWWWKTAPARAARSPRQA